MSCAKNEMKGVCTRIGGALLLFQILFSVFYGGAVSIEQILVKQFPNISAVHIITDLVSSACYAFSFLFPVAFFYLISKRLVAHPMDLELRFSKNHTILSTLAIVFLGMSVCHTCSYVNSILFPIPQSAYSLLESSYGDGYELALMFISTAIIPAFAEELLFRGMILSNLRPYSETGAILASAVLFGFMHQTPYQFFYTTCVGIVLGIVYTKTGTIWSSVLLHFCNNFISILQTYLVDKLDTITGNLAYDIITISTILIGIVCGALLAIKAKTKSRSSFSKEVGVYGRFDDDILKNRKNIRATAFLKAFLSPTILVFIVLSGISICSAAIYIWTV